MLPGEKRVEHVGQDMRVDGNRPQIFIRGLNVLMGHKNFHDQQRIDRRASLGQLLQPGEQPASECGSPI
jgi:hypothetical protein